MIPKVIHYCWFGGNPMPESALRCIESWKKYCPDYEIVRWDESNYDYKKNKYMYDAYKNKKWAFVSDYARVDIIHEFGGIYLDTDVELVKPLDSFLNDVLFCGWESRDRYYIAENPNYENSVNFGLGFGSERGHSVLKDILELYENLNFVNSDGSLNLLSCPHFQTLILKRYGADDNNMRFQKLDNVIIYPPDYFSPKSMSTGRIEITENTVSIHHFSMSWISPIDRMQQSLSWKLMDYIGYKNAKIVAKVIFSPYLLVKKFLYKQ